MRPDEARALGDLAGEALSAVSTNVRDVHRGIAGRVFAALGPAAAPVRVIHDGIATGVYAAVERSLRAGTRTLAIGAGASTSVPSLEATRRGRAALGVLNAILGDELERAGSPLALPMTIRAASDPTGRLAVFVHGLGETDDSWLTRETVYGERLAGELGYTPLYVRYNTGRHISENGRDLGELLDQVVAQWPVPVREIALIGHSMGGLVARSACHYHADAAFAGRVRHVIALGSPHRGAPLERVVQAASAMLVQAPESRAWAALPGRRSAGIKDLGRGHVVDEDWRDADPRAFIQRTGRELPYLRSADHYFVSASVTRDPQAPLGRLLGDMLVLRSSAWAHGGRGERLRFPVENYAHLGGVGHMDLLGHPAVYEQLRRWLAGQHALLAPSAPS